MSSIHYRYPSSTIRQRLFETQRDINNCRRLIPTYNIDIQILQSEINMIESEQPVQALLPTPVYYDHRQLNLLVNLVRDLRDWHEIVHDNAVEERYWLVHMVDSMNHREYP